MTACGDGSVRSPGIVPTTQLEALRIEADGPLSTPAGTQIQLRAIADFVRTVPPGTPGAEDGRIRSSEDVTERASWGSLAEAIATVDKGLVTGIAPGQASITARFQEKSDSVTVAVTDAVLEAVEFVKPEGVPRRSDDRYETLQGNVVPFEIFGRFSNGDVRELDTDARRVNWSSSVPTVADNSDDTRPERFDALLPGEAAITGALANADGVAPSEAVATLSVLPRSEVCRLELLAPGAQVTAEASDLCVGCNVEQPGAIIDGDDSSFARLSIPLGLLTQSVQSVIVSNPQGAGFSVGEAAAFLISRNSGLLSLELLSGVEVATVSCDVNGENCLERERFGDDAGAPLKLSLLGAVGAEGVRLLSTPPLGAASADANGLRLDFSAGLLSAAAELNVHTACAVSMPPE
ncbi:MAG: Ig-like domain-containing protein [Algiphilus sp.]